MNLKDFSILFLGNLSLVVGGFLNITKTAGADYFSGIGGGLLIASAITFASNYLTRKHETITK
jgi:uncharacterized membrane protein